MEIDDVAAGEVPGALYTSKLIRSRSQQDIAKPVRPLEFRLFMAIPFILLHTALAITLGVLFIKNRPTGKNILNMLLILA
jgi:hypothetical protein